MGLIFSSWWARRANWAMSACLSLAGMVVAMVRAGMRLALEEVELMCRAWCGEWLGVDPCWKLHPAMR